MVFWQNGTAINMLYRRSKKQIRGFTLIELLVSITIFVVIAVLTTSTLVLLSQVNREILARKELMDNATTILDSISLRARDIKQGTRILCVFPGGADYFDDDTTSRQGCPMPANSDQITFISGLPTAYFYYYQYDSSGKDLNYLRSFIFESSPLMGQNLNSTGIEVDEAKFYVSRALPKTLYNNIKPNYDSQYLTVSLVLSKMVGSKKVSLPIQASITTRW